MTLAELALDVYRRLDYADNPPPSVQSRIEGFINTHYVRLLSTDRMRPLRETTISLTTVVGQNMYILPVSVARVVRVTDVSGRYELGTKPLEWYRRVNPIGHIAGTPDTWVPTYMGEKEYTLTLHPTPTSELEYSVDIDHPIAPMVDPDDTPTLLPEDFHDLLSLLGRMDEYEFKSDDRYLPTKVAADKRVMELRQWVDNHTVYKRTALPDAYALVARDGGTPHGGLAAGSGNTPEPLPPEPHTILSAMHPDTIPGTLVSGDLLFVTTGGMLTRLPRGLPGQILKVQTGFPTWTDPPPEVPPGSGDVIGPASSLPQQIAVYANTSGKVIKPVTAVVSEAGDLTLGGTLNLPTRINFGGGPVAGAPSLIRNGPNVEVWLGDGAGYAPVVASSLVTSGPVNVGGGLTAGSVDTAGTVNASGAITGQSLATVGQANVGTTLHVGNGIWEHQRPDAMGEAVQVPFNPADYLGSGSMIWTIEPGDFKYCMYTLVGRMMFMSLEIQGSSLSGPMSTVLLVRVPGGYVPKYAVMGTACYVRNGTPTVLQNAYGLTTAGQPMLGVVRQVEQPYVASVNQTAVYLNMVIPLI